MAAAFESMAMETEDRKHTRKSLDVQEIRLKRIAMTDAGIKLRILTHAQLCALGLEA